MILFAADSSVNHFLFPAAEAVRIRTAIRASGQVEARGDLGRTTSNFFDGNDLGQRLLVDRTFPSRTVRWGGGIRLPSALHRARSISDFAAGRIALQAQQ